MADCQAQRVCLCAIHAQHTFGCRLFKITVLNICSNLGILLIEQTSFVHSEELSVELENEWESRDYTQTLGLVLVTMVNYIIRYNF